MAWWNALLAPVTNLIGEPLKQWGERRKIKLESKMQVEVLHATATVEKAKAEVELVKQGKATEADWDARAQEQAKFSWKDEVLMFILFLPVVLLFISAFFIDDAFQQRVIKAVNALEKFPLWYVVLLCGIVAAVFGLRWLVAPLVTKMAGKPKIP